MNAIGTDKARLTRPAQPGFGEAAVWMVSLLFIVGSALMGCQTQVKGREKVGGLEFTHFGGQLDLSARHRARDHDNTELEGAAKTRETILKESLELNLDGYVYHPNLLEFSSGCLLGLVQHEFKSTFSDPPITSRDNGTLQEYDLSAAMLKKKKYPSHYYARRHQSLEPRPYFSSVEQTLNEYGFMWRYVDDVLPQTFQYDNSDLKYNELGDQQDDRRYRNERFRYETAYYLNGEDFFTFNFEREAIREDPGNVRFDRDDYRFAHRLRFGDDYQHGLDSEFFYLDQTGTYEIDQKKWRESLRLKHSDTLRSWYALEWIKRSQQNQGESQSVDERSLDLLANVEHRLYDSLLSQFGVLYRQQKFEGSGDYDRTIWTTRQNYSKINPMGTLHINYTGEIQKTKRGDNTQPIPVIDEAHTFTDPDPIVLDNTGVLPETIVVTNAAGTQIYQLNGDYTIFSFANRTEIHRMLSGLIADGDTVLVDYQFNYTSSASLDATDHVVEIRHDFDFDLSPYYRFEKRNQNQSANFQNATTPEDLVSHTFGVEYTPGSFYALAEYENNNSSVAAFDSRRVNASYSHRFSNGAIGNVGSRWSKSSYKAPNERKVSHFSSEVYYQQPITDTLSFSGAVRYRKERDSSNRNDEGYDTDLSLRYTVRKMDIWLTYEYNRYRDDFARNQTSMVFLQIRRSF